jgi:hypothetical protein
MDGKTNRRCSRPIVSVRPIEEAIGECSNLSRIDVLVELQSGVAVLEPLHQGEQEGLELGVLLSHLFRLGHRLLKRMEATVMRYERLQLLELIGLQQELPQRPEGGGQRSGRRRHSESKNTTTSDGGGARRYAGQSDRARDDAANYCKTDFGSGSLISHHFLLVTFVLDRFG